MARSGAAGVACSTDFLPASPATAAAARSSSPTISAAAQAGSASASARMVAASRQATPYSARRPAAPNAPMPLPAFLPFSASSAWARRSSLRMSSGHLLAELVDERAERRVAARR